MERPLPQPDQSQPRRDAGESSHGLPVKQREQVPQDAGSKSLELDRRGQGEEAAPAPGSRESTSLQLGRWPFLPGFDKAPAYIPPVEEFVETLDPDVEEAIRQYGMTFEDPQERAVEEERLRQSARKYRETRESLLGHTVSLARPLPDVSRALKKGDKKE